MGHLIIRPANEEMGNPFSKPWSIGDFPKPPPPDTRPTTVATERMLWRRDGSLAAARGHHYITEDEPLLITHTEWLKLQEAE